MAEPFAVGAWYTNEEIAAALGGLGQNYLRFVAPRRVVAICLNAWEHPRAPAGHSDGGQFIDTHGGASHNRSAATEKANAVPSRTYKQVEKKL